MKVEYDREADALYIKLNSKGYAFGEDVDDQRRVDYAADGTPIGVEFLYVSEGVNLRDLPHSPQIAEALERLHIRILTS